MTRTRFLTLAGLALSAVVSCGGGRGSGVDGARAPDAGDVRPGDGADAPAGDVNDLRPGDAADTPVDTGDGPASEAVTGTDSRDLGGSTDTGDLGGADGGAADLGAACFTHSDCPELAGPPLRHCPSSYWSCLRPPGRCVRECVGSARTCRLDPDGCVRCNIADAAATCAGDPCVVRANRQVEVESTTCAQPPQLDFTTCRGGWLVRPDGSLCVIQVLATGAIRYAVSCPECTTIVVQY